MRLCALTTKDNEFSYFDEYDQWVGYESLTGNRATLALARHAFTSSSLSPEENAIEIERAIDEIIKYDLTNSFVKEVKVAN